MKIQIMRTSRAVGGGVLVLTAALMPLGASAQKPTKPKPALSLAERETEKSEVKPSVGALTPVAVTFARKGDAALRSGDIAGAGAAYAQAALVEPQDPLLRMMTGVALSSVRQNDLALPQFRHAYELADDDVIAALLYWSALADHGDATEAQQIYQDTFRRFSLPGGKSGLNTSGSVARLTAALRQMPDSAVLYLLLGDAYQFSEQWTLADSAYREARRRSPLWSKPAVNYGISLLAQGKSDAAIRMFADALRLDPKNAQAQVFKGDAELRAGHSRQAILTLKPVTVDSNIARPLKAQAATSLGQAFARNQSYGQAIATLDTAQKLAPGDPTPSALMGEIRLQNGDFEGASRAYRTALGLTRGGGLFSTRPVLYRALAEAQLSARKPADALETLSRALTEEPADAPLWHRLMAQAYFDENVPGRGESELCDALDREQNRWPFDTLNAIAARNLLTRVRDRYRRELESADTGFRTEASAGGGPLSISSASKDAATPAARARALSALAHIARYENNVTEEIERRRALTNVRTTGPDWFLLAETYDLRADQPANARESYRRALEIGGLTDAQKRWARTRLETLVAPSYRP